jgi:uncharacterized RmlC-like cupin family protein
MQWHTAGVRVVRAGSVQAGKSGPLGSGRATAFDFARGGDARTWIGSVTMAPQAYTGPHHHGRHEVAVYVASGRSEIRWGDRLEFCAEVSPGDFVYFAPHVPHSERNLSSAESLVFVVVRSDNEKIAIDLDTVPVEHPERIY